MYVHHNFTAKQCPQISKTMSLYCDMTVCNLNQGTPGCCDVTGVKKGKIDTQRQY